LGLVMRYVMVEVPGGGVMVRWPGPGVRVWLMGPAATVFEGVVEF
jgi:hypothetical protein